MMSSLGMTASPRKSAMGVVTGRNHFRQQVRFLGFPSQLGYTQSSEQDFHMSFFKYLLQKTDTELLRSSYIQL